MRSTAYTSARPRYDLADIVGLLFRQIGIMLLVFLVIAVLGIVNTLALSVIERTREVGLLRAWIDQGADWPASADVAASKGANHWAFKTIKRPAVPKVKNNE